jgi:pimeloyl-ACP methyl ester carboxylesterase
LREIAVPALVVCGAEDALTPVADSEAIHRGLPGSRLVVIPRAGHLPALEDPAAFHAALTAFLPAR